MKRLAYLLAGVVQGVILLAASSASSQPDASSKIVKLSFDTLKQWTYVQGKTPIPDFIKKLDGVYVEMTGFMISPNSSDNISDFVLAPTLWGCCYGQPPAVNHVVLVKMSRGRETEYYEKAIRVRGRFHVGEERIDDCVVSLYRLDADDVALK